MAVTTNRRTPHAQASSAPDASTMPKLVRAMALPRRRRPWLVAGGAMLAILGALTALWLVNATAQRRPVLVMARTVAMGSVLTGADLGVTDVSTDPGVATMAASRRSDVVGAVARTELVAGSLVAPAALTTAAPPARGEVLVVLALPPSRMPASRLVPGTPVLVVSTPTADADATSTGAPPTIAATVVRVGTPDLNGVTTVDVTVPAGDGPALAARAATGRIAVVVRPAGGK
jgi:hypothetical protein